MSNPKFNKNDYFWIFGRLRKGEEFLVEDPMRKGFLDNYGFIMSLGGVYLTFPGNWIISMIHLITSCGQIVCFIYTAYLTSDDLGNMIEALHFTVIMMTISCPAVINGLLQRERLERIMRSLGEGVYDYEETLDDESLQEIKEFSIQARAQKNFFSRIFLGIIVATLFTISLFKPLAMNLLLTIEYGDDFDGINKQVPVHSWYPLDSRVPLFNLLCFMLQYIAIFTVPSAVCGLDVIYLCIAQEIVIQLKIVGISMKNLKKRAMKVMKLNGINDMEKSISTCLSHSIKHHIVLARLFEDFRNYHFYILLSVMTGATFMLCLAGIIFTTDSVALVFRLTYVVFLVTELVHVLLFCWYGDQIKEMSIKIGEDIYGADWFNNSGHMRLHMLMIMQKIMKPLKVTAGGFMEASMNTYANVLSNAYSYFNLVKATR